MFEIHISTRVPRAGTGFETPPWATQLSELQGFKVTRKFFLKHNKSLRWHLGKYEKHIFFHLKACERRKFDFCVFLRMFSMPGGRVGPSVATSAPSIQLIYTGF